MSDDPTTKAAPAIQKDRTPRSMPLILGFLYQAERELSQALLKAAKQTPEEYATYAGSQALQKIREAIGVLEGA